MKKSTSLIAMACVIFIGAVSTHAYTVTIELDSSLDAMIRTFYFEVEGDIEEFSGEIGEAVPDAWTPMVEIDYWHARGWDLFNTYETLTADLPIASWDILDDVGDGTPGVFTLLDASYLWTGIQGDTAIPFSVSISTGPDECVLYTLSAVPQVPVPPSVLLLASGIIALIGYRRGLRSG